MNAAQIESSDVLNSLVFTKHNTGSKFFYTYTDHLYHSMPETVEHKNIRMKERLQKFNDDSTNNGEISVSVNLLLTVNLLSVMHYTPSFTKHNFCYYLNSHRIQKRYTDYYI